MEWWKEKPDVLKGVGAQRLSDFHRLNIFTLGDLLEYFPRQDAYIDQSQLKTIAELVPDGSRQLFCASVVRGTERLAGSGKRYGVLTLGDAEGYAEVFLFGGQRFLARHFKAGEKVLASGRIKPGRVAPIVAEPLIVPADAEHMEEQLGILPVYSLTGALSQNILRAAVRQTLAIAEREGVTETLAPEILRRYNFPGRLEAYRALHFPRNPAERERARKRFIYEELFLLQCGLLLARKKNAEERLGVRHGPDGALVKKVRASLPFKLTPAQGKAWREIARDMERPEPMRRLLQGDVGSGKTVLAALALAKTAENGYQGIIMAPTGILARQHYETFARCFKGTDVNVALLTSATGQAERSEMLALLREGKIQLLIGTHAVLQEDVELPKLALIVTDEQHRFGVQQRAKLAGKSPFVPDVLIMTATPIPRTLALTLYGDVEVSQMRGKPPGRREVTTLCYRGDRRGDLYAGLVRQVNAGRQAYVVCAAIDAGEAEELDAKFSACGGEASGASDKNFAADGEEKFSPPLRSAVQVYEELRKTYLKNIPCALLHGKMKNAEKEAVMEAFAAGRVKVLVTTTVVEVGVNVPNATLMLIENADRYGLAQLHQLRGRVGRGERQSYCALITDSTQQDAWERLQALRSSGDGFELAEKDLRLRGAGTLFGLKQHGLPDLHIADIMRDVRVLKLARGDAEEALEDAARREKLRAEVAARFDERFAKIFDF